MQHRLLEREIDADYVTVLDPKELVDKHSDIYDIKDRKFILDVEKARIFMADFRKALKKKFNEDIDKGLSIHFALLNVDASRDCDYLIVTADSPMYNSGIYFADWLETALANAENENKSKMVYNISGVYDCHV